MNKSKKIWIGTAKLFLFLLLIFCFYLQWQSYPIHEMKSISWDSLKLFSIGICLLLMPLNWLVEAFKWQAIHRANDIKITWSESLASVIFGAFAGFVTPGRWGEPIARSFYLKSAIWRKKMYWNLTGIIAQWIITLAAGMIALYYTSAATLSSISIWLLGVGLVLLICLYAFYDGILAYIGTMSIFSFIGKFSEADVRVSKETKWKVFLLSLLRFAVYSSQYLVLCYAFIPAIPIETLLMKIFLLFLLQSFSFFPAFLDIGVKGNLALFLFKDLIQSPMQILFVVFAIWMINLLIPALIGYFLFHDKLSAFQASTTSESTVDIKV